MSQQAASLAYEWRRLTRAATIVAVLTSPALFFVFHVGNGWSVPVSVLATFVAVIAFRGLVDVIAKHVGGRYRLSSGDQLVLVTGGPLRVASLDIPVRLTTRETAGGASEVKGGSVMYQLCGLGPRCAINKGKPSTERFLLLRREALELALYSFRYLGGVKNVVALLPPAPGKKPENAMLFRKGRYEGTLDRPLAATLPSPPPTLNALPDSPEAGLIQRLTDENLFRYSFQQGQDLSAFLVLQALPGS